MATFDLHPAIKPTGASWGLGKAGVQFKSPFNGRVQAVDFIAERWMFSATMAPMIDYAAGEMEVLANQLAGGVNRLRAGHPTRKVPRGTLRGTPTIQSAATRGATSIVVSATSGQTLETGDYVGVAFHLLQVAAACVSVGGVIVIPIVNRIRSTIPIGTAVTWNQPKALFVCRSMLNSSVHMPGIVEGAALDFEEVWD